MKILISNKYRFRYTIIGLLLPFDVLVLGFLCAVFSGLYILWYPIYLITIIPGYLVQGKGYLTLALTSLFWGSAGFAVGYAKDRRQTAGDKHRTFEWRKIK